MKTRTTAWGALALTVSIAALADGGRWILGDGGADGAGPVLSLESADGIRDESGRSTVQPSLEIFCTAGEPDGIGVRIDWHRFISSFNTEVGFRVGDGKRRWLKLGVDATNRVTLAGSASDATTLLDLFASGETLSVEVSPYSEAPLTAQFELTGLAAALADLRAACR